MINADLFDEIKTEESAYWLGFFCADGYSHKNGKQITILLAERDSNHLYKFGKLFNRPIKHSSHFDKRTNKIYHRVTCHLHSKSLYQSIANKGVPQQKTKKLTGVVFNYISNSVINHFIRGYFDGDGCISKIGVAEYRINIVGTSSFIKRLTKVVRKECGITGGSISNVKNLYNILWCGTDRIQIIRQWLYKDATIYLERKKEIFDKVPLHRGVSKYKYVYWSPSRNRWLARYYDGKMKTIGQYKTEEEAANARNQFALAA